MKKNMLIRIRDAKGQAIVGGTTALSLAVAVTVGLFCLLLNVFFVCNYSIKAQLVASEAAKMLDSRKYWLGLPRVDYDPGKAKLAAVEAANYMCRSLGLPQVQGDDVVIDQENSRISLTIRNCEIPFTNIAFPSLIPVTAVGVCPQSIMTPYGIMQIGVPVPGSPNQYQIVTLPAYGFCQGTKNVGGGYTNVIGFMGGDKSGIGQSNSLGLGSFNWFSGLPLKDQQFHQILLKGRNASK